MDENKISVEVTKEHALMAGPYADPTNCLLAVAFRGRLGLTTVGEKYIEGTIGSDGCYLFELTGETLKQAEESYFQNRWWHRIPFLKKPDPLTALPRKDFKPFTAIAYRR